MGAAGGVCCGGSGPELGFSGHWGSDARSATLLPLLLTPGVLWPGPPLKLAGDCWRVSLCLWFAVVFKVLQGVRRLDTTTLS